MEAVARLIQALLPCNEEQVGSCRKPEAATSSSPGWMARVAYTCGGDWGRGWQERWGASARQQNKGSELLQIEARPARQPAACAGGACAHSPLEVAPPRHGRRLAAATSRPAHQLRLLAPLLGPAPASLPPQNQTLHKGTVRYGLAVRGKSGGEGTQLKRHACEVAPLGGTCRDAACMLHTTVGWLAADKHEMPWQAPLTHVCLAGRRIRWTVPSLSAAGWGPCAHVAHRES